MVQYWRLAGFTFLKYQRISASALRTVVKEPFKTKAETRGTAVFNYTEWKEGKALRAAPYAGKD
ncbi:hypothetical protein PROFUN_09299 [Planoprotostelium fungivorum]|uniref:Uncharacterized protein n=1 Tax=Planoprotostelium fungivorum TaxID=1890364 RepID=A0A2P6NH89_9EUKA|nr:hypothetical protein PROFUN_09299 [Planoprotostelium fungivorum]